jgi:hydroxymethylpyrimidine pyrophosphatase-like HAD family hydrolase
MARDAVERMVDYFHRAELPYFLQADDALYASDAIEQVFADFWRQRIAERIAEAQRLGVTLQPEETVEIDHQKRFRNTVEADLGNVARAVFVSSDEDAVDRVRAALGEDFHVAPGSMPRPMIGERPAVSGEIAPNGVSKGAAIRTVLEHLGIDPADSIGIGDSWNDVEMFEVCGVAVAMGNAHPMVQEFADQITTPVLHGGVRDALTNLGLV